MLNIFLLVNLLVSLVYADDQKSDLFAGKDSMNGYKFSEFLGFEKKWKLVTVRFRTDTGELRFTYANDLAWETMLAGKVNYPDGAIFGKTGYMTSDDMAFISSKVPSGTRRYQFMYKDKKKHKNHDGWGYSLFDADGKTFPEDPVVKVESCVACHRLVPDRGYVFSEPMNPTDFLKSVRGKYSSTKKSALVFEKIRTAKISGHLNEYLLKEECINVLTGPIQKNIFQGALDEIIPSLLDMTEKTKIPSVLATDSFERFTLVKFVKGQCPDGDGFEVIQTDLNKDIKNNYITRKKIVCK